MVVYRILYDQEAVSFLVKIVGEKRKEKRRKHAHAFFFSLLFSLFIILDNVVRLQV